MFGLIMFGEFDKCAFKVTEVDVLEAGNLFVSQDFRGQQPERSLDEPCSLARRHTLLVGPSKLCQQMAETVFKQSGDAFAEAAFDERQVMKIQKLRLEVVWLHAAPKLRPINRIRVEDGAVFMKKTPQLPGITVVLQSRSGCK